MKIDIKYLCILGVSALIVGACQKPPVAQKAEVVPVFTPARADGKEFKLDTLGSEIKWLATKATGKHHGTIKLKSGSIFFKDGKVVAGHFVVDMKTIEVLELTGEMKAKLTRHLLSADFFDTEKFSEGVFEISTVEKSSTNSVASYQIKGNLTLKGITRGIAFEGVISADKNAPASAKATFNIDRKQWGIIYPGRPDDLISDTINLSLDLKVKT